MINPFQKEQHQQLEKIEICIEILKDTRNELYLSMRFFDAILSNLEWLADGKINGFGTDGHGFYYKPDALIQLYKKSGIYINRGYLHSILHCLFHHLYVPQKYNKELWDLSCDIVAENILDSMNKRALRVYINPYRKNIYHKLKEELPVLSPKGVYKTLLKWELTEEEQLKLFFEFYRDDHCYWVQEDHSKKQSEQQKIWKDLNEKLQLNMETFSKEEAQEQKTLFQQVQFENREKYDYKKFLKKFAVLKEEIQVDPDSFDYIFYHYGMELYGNVPLIEYQETKESLKIQDFVIAIDTSMSCKKDLIKRFLEETYSILNESESYFKKIHIHIIQCDEKVQSDTVIHNREELKEYTEQFEIKGFGGTDFRPVFGYVNELMKNKVFHHLKGLIYFTDGYGIFPLKRPLYETAFVFMKEDYTDKNIPSWAMKVIIAPEDLEFE